SGAAEPKVAVAGDTYLVIWNGVFGRIVRNGMLAGDAFAIEPSGVASTIASDGDGFIVATWLFGGAGNVLRTARIAPNGAVVARGADIPIHSATGRVSPALACSRNECLLAWRDELLSSCQRLVCDIDERVKGVRLLPSLAVRDAEPLVLSDDNSFFSGTVA